MVEPPSSWVAAATLLMVAALSGAALAQDLSGFGELRVQGQLGVDGNPIQVVERFRPTFTGELGERARLVATVELGLAQGRHQQREFERIVDEAAGPFLEAAGCAWPEPGVALLNIDGIDDALTIERFYADIYLPWADLRVGRQSITWGSALMINPTDPFPELLLAEPWRPRQGLDAARAIINLPGYNDLTLVAGSNRALDAVRAAGRLRLNVAETDVALVGAWRTDGGAEGEGNGIVGLDVKGTLELGYWLESALHLGDDDLYVEVAVGLDYSFPVLENLIVSAQYYFNQGGGDVVGGGLGGGLSGAIRGPDCGCSPTPDGMNAAMPDAMSDGSDDTADPFAALLGGEAAARDPFAPLLGGEHYLLLAASLGFDLDWSGSLFWLQNLGDGTAFVVPTLNYVARDWLTVSLSAQVPLDLGGDGGEFSPADADLTLALPTGDTLDFTGLVPAASLTAWARASF